MKIVFTHKNTSLLFFLCIENNKASKIDLPQTFYIKSTREKQNSQDFVKIWHVGMHKMKSTYKLKKSLLICKMNKNEERYNQGILKDTLKMNFISGVEEFSYQLLNV